MDRLQKLAQLELARRAIARELAEEEMERVAGGVSEGESIESGLDEAWGKFEGSPEFKSTPPLDPINPFDLGALDKFSPYIEAKRRILGPAQARYHTSVNAMPSDD